MPKKEKSGKVQFWWQDEDIYATYKTAVKAFKKDERKKAVDKFNKKYGKKPKK